MEETVLKLMPQRSRGRYEEWKLLKHIVIPDMYINTTILGYLSAEHNLILANGDEYHTDNLIFARECEISRFKKAVGMITLLGISKIKVVNYVYYTNSLIVMRIRIADGYFTVLEANVSRRPFPNKIQLEL